MSTSAEHEAVGLLLSTEPLNLDSFWCLAWSLSRCQDRRKLCRAWILSLHCRRYFPAPWDLNSAGVSC
jgi:hypothetical protein